MICERLLCEAFTILRDLNNTQKHTADTIPQNKIFAKTLNINVRSQLFSETKKIQLWQ